MRFAGPRKDITPADSQHRIATTVVAIDALIAHNAHNQFSIAKMMREIVKSYTGFSVPESLLGRSYTKISTGNWGCGMFGGFVPLKSMLQLVLCTKKSCRAQLKRLSGGEQMGLYSVFQL